MVLTGLPMGAQEAMQRGLVSKVFPVDKGCDNLSIMSIMYGYVLQIS